MTNTPPHRPFLQAQNFNEEELGLFKALVQGHSKSKIEFGSKKHVTERPQKFSPTKKWLKKISHLKKFSISEKKSKEKYFVSEFVLVIQIDSGGLSATCFLDPQDRIEWGETSVSPHFRVSLNQGFQQHLLCSCGDFFWGGGPFYPPYCTV